MADLLLFKYLCAAYWNLFSYFRIGWDMALYPTELPLIHCAFLYDFNTIRINVIYYPWIKKALEITLLLNLADDRMLLWCSSNHYYACVLWYYQPVIFVSLLFLVPLPFSIFYAVIFKYFWKIMNLFIKMYMQINSIWGSALKMANIPIKYW